MLQTLALTLAALSLADLSLADLSLADQHALELPEGGVSRAWAAVGPETIPVDPRAALEEVHPWLFADSLNSNVVERWRDWGLWLAAARVTDKLPQARAGLALLALREERWSDLWRHTEALGAHPAWLAGLMPICLPGAPVELAPRAGGRAASLPAGVLLTPAPPPPRSSSDPMGSPVRSAVVHQLEIGGALVELRVALEPTGVQIDLTHLSGPTTSCAVLMPEPEGFELAVEYIDWLRQDALRAPLQVELAAGGSTVTLFARGRPRSEPLPASPRNSLPAVMTLGGLTLVAAPGTQADEAARAAALAFGKVLSIPTRVCAAGEEAQGRNFDGTIVHLPADAEAQARLLSRLASRIETWVLR